MSDPRVFRRPSASAEGILGVRPGVASHPPSRVLAHLQDSSLLAAHERVVAAVDSSWRMNGASGVVVTTSRVFRYRERDVDELTADGWVDRIVVRRMWYPGWFGRGEVFGAGPVVVLRLAFHRPDGRTKRLRISEFAFELYPLLAALFDRYGINVEVARTLPGL